MQVKTTNKIEIYKYLNGKEYPIIVKVQSDGTIKIDISRHPGSEKQLTEIIESLANVFGTTYEVEKHIHHNHTHTYDKNLDKQGM